MIIKDHLFSLILFTCLVFSFGVRAQPPEVVKAYQPGHFVSQEGDTLLYRILYPENYGNKPGQKYPLLLFLHGAGERGSDNKKQLVHGASLFLQPSMRQKFPAIVVFPQCPAGDTWANYRKIMDAAEAKEMSDSPAPATTPMSLVMALHEKLIKEETVDTSRLYVMGLSMGGFGTFDILSRKPQTFAAAVPICGGGNPHLAPLYAPHTALWITHGANDNVVPVENSRSMYRALVAAGADVRYTEFAETNHNAWDVTFALQPVWNWMFREKSSKMKAQSSKMKAQSSKEK